MAGLMMPINKYEGPYDPLPRTSKGIVDWHYDKAKDALLEGKPVTPVLIVHTEDSISVINLDEVMEKSTSHGKLQEVMNSVLVPMKPIAYVFVSGAKMLVKKNEVNAIESQADVLWGVGQYVGQSTEWRFLQVDDTDGSIKLVECQVPREIVHQSIGGFFDLLGAQMIAYDDDALFQGSKRVDRRTR